MIKFMVTIRDYERRSDKVYYSIVVNGCNSCKVLSKRYSDLKNLHDLIAQKNVDFKLKLTLPAFPGRKIFGKTKNSVNDIVSRGLELQQYLEQVINIPQLHTFEAIKEFLPKIEIREESIELVRNGKEYSKDLCWQQMDELKQSYLQRHQFLTPKSNKTKSTTLIGYLQRYHFTIDDYVIQQDIVQYTLTLTDAKKTTKYQLTTRYRDLRDYHNLLEKKNFKAELPQFPKRRLIGQTIDNPQQIQERLEQLQKYLNDLFSEKEFVESEPMKFFITRIKLEGKPIFYEIEQRGSQQVQNTDTSPYLTYISQEEGAQIKSF